jgi:histidinol-phosphate phosphatase family protein
MSKPCVFFDRDGIANVAPPPEEYYVLSVDRFFVVPEFLESLRIVADKGYPAVIVTNQKSVHRGLLTPEGLEDIHNHLRAAIKEAGAELLAIYSCPHGDGHPDRKPAPGMLLKAAEEHDLDLGRSWMIGDTPRDMQAGLAAGCPTNVLVGAEGDEDGGANYKLSGMSELPGFLEEKLPTLMD